MFCKFNKFVWLFGSVLILSLMVGSPGLALVTVDIEDELDVEIVGSTFQANLPDSLAVGDFNGDGVDDLAMGIGKENSYIGTTRTGLVSIFNGGADFLNLPGPPTEIEVGNIVGGTPEYENTAIFGTTEEEAAGTLLAAGDLDNDGTDDLVVVAQNERIRNHTTAQVYILFGGAGLTGLLPFSTARNVLLDRDVAHFTALAVGDVNGDGIDDLVIADDLTDEVSVPPMHVSRDVDGVVYVIYGRARAAWPAAIDLKTEADVMITRDNGDGVFQVKSLAIGDVNGDSQPDLAMGAPWEDKVNAFGTTTEAGNVYLVWGGTALAAVSNIDTIASSVISGALESDRIGGVLETNVNGHPLAIGDVTGDGVGDVIIGAPLSMLGVPSSTGVGKAEVVFGQTGFPAAVDLVTDADVRMILWDESPRLFYTGYAVSGKDLNGDGVGDITVSTPCWQVNSANPRCDGIVHSILGGGSLASSYFLEPDATFAWEPPPPTDPLSASETGTCLAIGELTNAKTPDLALGSPFGGLNTRGWTAVFNNAVLPALKANDFNADDKADVIYRHPDSGKIGVWLMDGTTESSWVYIGNHGTAWDMKGVGDFNRDGHNDMVYRHTNGKVGLWLMEGTTEKAWYYLGNHGTAWDVRGVGDFNNDRNPDVLYRHTASGKMGVWLMNGGMETSWVYIGNHGTAWDAKGVGDLNNDGQADVVYRNASGNVGVWLMNGTTETSWKYLGNHGATWDAKTVADYNGDGHNDVIYRNTSGKVGIWLMNGTTETTWQYLGNHGVWDIR